jgi:hypothetical protein
MPEVQIKSTGNVEKLIDLLNALHLEVTHPASPSGVESSPLAL